jgi:hypothetical protein
MRDRGVVLDGKVLADPQAMDGGDRDQTGQDDDRRQKDLRVGSDQRRPPRGL